MRERRYVFLVVCLLMFYGKINGQKIPEKSKPLPHIPFKLMPRPQIHPTLNPSQISIFGSYSLANKFELNAPIPGNHFFKQLPFFCRTELQIEKTINIPFRFRVGSPDHVNYLEGKHKYYVPMY